MSLTDDYRAAGFMTKDAAEDECADNDAAVCVVEPKYSDHPDVRGASVIMERDANHGLLTHELKDDEVKQLKEYLTSETRFGGEMVGTPSHNLGEDDYDINYERRCSYKANAVNESLVTDGEYVWAENEDDSIDAEAFESALDAIEAGVEEVSLENGRVEYDVDRGSERDGWRGEEHDYGIPLYVEIGSRLRATNMDTVRALLDEDDSVEGIEVVEDDYLLNESHAKLVSDGDEIWYDAFPEDRITLDQLRDALSAVESGAEEVSFDDVTISAEVSFPSYTRIRFHHSSGKRAIGKESLEEFITVVDADS